MGLRRKVAIAYCGIALAATSAAQAQDYPTQPLRFIVPAGAGGGADVFARIIATKMPELIGQSAFVENVPGAGGLVGAERVAHSRPDGHTVLYGINAIFTLIPALQKIPPAVKDMRAVTVLTLAPYIWIATNELPAKTLPELIALARTKPDRVSYASTGVGSAAHLGGELLAAAASVTMLHVPFKNTGIAELIAGQVDLKLEPPGSAMPHIRNGRLRAIAVSSSKRMAALPDVPAVAELLPGYEVMGWQGVWLPAATPPAIVDKLRAAFAKALQLPDVRPRVIEVGAEPIGSTPEEAQRTIERELAMWTKLIRDRGIRAE
jgi:tripartite-type tricarboxylate transporter receptor subunit TctC